MIRCTACGKESPDIAGLCVHCGVALPAAPVSRGSNSPPESMNYAMWADRVLAALLDMLIVGGGVLVVYIAISILGIGMAGAGAGIGQLTGGDDGQAAGSMLGGGFCCIAFVLLPLVSLGVGLYNKVHLVSQRGYSIGQGVMHLKVVTAAGTLVPFQTLLLRLLVQVGFGFVAPLSLLSILWPLWDPQRQALHDKAVGTFVIKTT